MYFLVWSFNQCLLRVPCIIKHSNSWIKPMWLGDERCTYFCRYVDRFSWCLCQLLSSRRLPWYIVHPIVSFHHITLPSNFPTIVSDTFNALYCYWIHACCNASFMYLFNKAHVLSFYGQEPKTEGPKIMNIPKSTKGTEETKDQWIKRARKNQRRPTAALDWLRISFFIN